MLDAASKTALTSAATDGADVAGERAECIT
jgi:hypothetical protein